MTCIEGTGFDSKTGGFAAILVDEMEVPKSVIAAAPDLLAALEGANKLLWQEGFTTSQPEVAAIEAAITKARGE